MTTPARLPPGPLTTPWQMAQVIFDPDAALLNMVRRYGDPVTDRSAGKPLVFSCTPEGAKQILTADPDTFAVPDPEFLTPVLGEHSVLFLVGERHRAERKLVNPHFHGDRMRAYAETVHEVAERHIAAWRIGETWLALDQMQQISLEVIIRAVFGVERARVPEFRAAVINWVTSFSPVIVFFRWLRRDFAGHGPWARLQRARAAIDRMLDEEIASRRKSLAAGEALGSDILSRLIAARYEDGSAMSDAQLRDELLTLLFAGHETTAISLSWALYYLLSDPSLYSRVRGEVDALGAQPQGEAIAQLPLLSAVCSETLRLHPVVPILPPRRLQRPFQLMGHELPPDVMVSVGTLRLHKREDLYPNPYAFIADRFVNRSPSPFEYMPFGGGVRRCIGASFALYEMKIVLATILRTTQLSLATDKPVRDQRRNAVLGPSHNLKLLLASRRSAAT
jgi:cytochrome P450 family 110